MKQIASPSAILVWPLGVGLHTRHYASMIVTPYHTAQVRQLPKLVKLMRAGASNVDFGTSFATFQHSGKESG